MIDASSPLVDVAWAVCTALDRNGVTAVLTGGSAATYYAPDAYQSVDLDLVAVRFGATLGEDIESALTGLGYVRYVDHYEHTSSPYPIEFPPGPLAIGGEILEHWRTERHTEQILHVLEPTDSCKDRLAAFVHWNDRASLAQALAVAKAVPAEIGLEELRRWAAAEGNEDKFFEFARRLT